MIVTTVRLPDDIHARLNIEALKSKTTISEIIRKRLEPQPDITDFTDNMIALNSILSSRLTAIEETLKVIVDYVSFTQSNKKRTIYNNLIKLINNFTKEVKS